MVFLKLSSIVSSYEFQEHIVTRDQKCDKYFPQTRAPVIAQSQSQWDWKVYAQGKCMLLTGNVYN